MAKISFSQKDLPTLEIQTSQNLMKTLLAHKVPVASSCHGEGVCAKCKVQVLSNPENLTPAQDHERFLLQKHHLPPGWRISCQCSVLGDIDLDTGYW